MATKTRVKHKWIILAGLLSHLFLETSHGAAVAEGSYSMNSQVDCLWAGQLDVPRDQTTYLNGRGADVGIEVTTCRLQFAPQTGGDTLELEVLPGFYIDNTETSLTVDMDGQNAVLGSLTQSSQLPKLTARDGVATVAFVRPTIDVTGYYFQVSIKAYRSVEEVAAGGGGDDTEVGMIVGIVAGVILIILVLCVIFILCRRKRRERLAEKRQFVNGGAAGLPEPYVDDPGKVENVAYTKGVNYGSPSSNRRLLGKLPDGSDDGTYSSGGEKPRSALDRFGVPPSQRRGRQQVGPREEEGGRRRDAYAVESEAGTGRPRAQPRFGTNRGGDRREPGQDYEDVDDHGAPGQKRDGSPPGSPLLSALRNNPKFRRSFHENEADAEERARRVSSSSSGELRDARDPDRLPEKPKLPPVPRSPPRSPSPQRRGEKIAAIYRARPSSSHDAARLDSEGSNDTPPRENPSARDTRHTLRPNRSRRSPDRSPPRDERRRGRSRADEDDDDESDREERRRQQRRRDREDEERQRRRRQEEDEEREEEERRKRKKKEEERKRREEEDRKRREDEEDEDRRRRRAAKESDGSEYEGRFKKSASGRRSKGKGPRMGRSRSTGNALEEMEDRYQRSRSKSPGSAHSLNFVEGDEDETDLDSNYQPFRRAGSKTSLYASRSSLYGRRRKNSMGETMSMSSRTALDDTDSRMGDFDKSRLSQTELNRLYKSTGELEMRPESAHLVREVGTDTSGAGSVTVGARKTVAKGRHGKRYSRGTQTLTSSRGRDRRDSVGSARSGRSTSSKNKLKSRTRSRESLGGRRSRSRGLSDDDQSDSDASRRRRRRSSKSRSREKLDVATDDSEDDSVSKKSGRSGARSTTSSKPRGSSKPRKSNRSADGLSDSEQDGIADDQSVAPSSIYGAAPQQYPQGFVAPPMVAGYPPQPLVYQPMVAPGGPPVPYPVAAVPPPVSVKPVIAPKPKPGGGMAAKPAGSRWDELVNLTDGMKKRRRQMGESITEDGTESVLSSMWSQPTYNQQPTAKVPPSYTTANHLNAPNQSYSSNYPDSSGGYNPYGAAHNTRMASYSPSESNV